MQSGVLQTVASFGEISQSTYSSVQQSVDNKIQEQTKLSPMKSIGRFFTNLLFPAPVEMHKEAATNLATTEQSNTTKTMDKTDATQDVAEGATQVIDNDEDAESS